MRIAFLIFAACAFAMTLALYTISAAQADDFDPVVAPRVRSLQPLPQPPHPPVCITTCDATRTFCTTTCY